MTTTPALPSTAAAVTIASPAGPLPPSGTRRRVLRPVLTALGLTYGLAVTAALAMPHMNVVPLISMAFPTVALLLTLVIAVPRGSRRSTWAAVGWRRPGLWGTGMALLIPAAIMTASYGLAGAVGVARFPNLHVGLAGSSNLVTALVLGTFFALAEEIGWRGFIYPQLSQVAGMKRAAILTGATHAAFHLPLLLLTTTYQSAGHRWIVVPMVMATITAAGVVYAWLREVTGSVWPVAIMHNAFNTFVDLGLTVSVAGSAATLAYVTTETGVFTLLIALGSAGWLLTRTWVPRSRD